MPREVNENRDRSVEPNVNSLIAAAWGIYTARMHEPFVVTPSLPILFFGDSTAYARSPLKIITVGLNPSLHEFPVQDRFARFRAAATVASQTQPRLRAYLDALNQYFRCNPYRAWFRCFEPILQGLGASYYDGANSTALNTDLLSPLATQPTWSGLTPQQRSCLIADGVRLWHDLVEHLAPDVILISVARSHVQRIEWEQLEMWRTIYTIEQRKDGTSKRAPYFVQTTRVRLQNGRTALLVFGAAAHTPFGLLSNTDKQAIGARIGSLVAGCKEQHA